MSDVSGPRAGALPSAVALGLLACGWSVAGADENTAPVLVDTASVAIEAIPGASLLVPLPAPESRATDAEADVLGYRFAGRPGVARLELAGATMTLARAPAGWTLSVFPEPGFRGPAEATLEVVEIETVEGLASDASFLVRIGVDEPQALFNDDVPATPAERDGAAPVVPVSGGGGPIEAEPAGSAVAGAGTGVPAEAARLQAAQGLRLVAVSDAAIVLAWDGRAGMPYTVFRDGATLATIEGDRFVDEDVNADVEYVYSVARSGADATGSGSGVPAEAMRVTAKARARRDTASPRAPGEVYALRLPDASVAVAWPPGGDDRAVSGYDVYRDGRYVDTVRSTAWIDAAAPAAPGTHYEIVAFDEARNYSPRSIATFVDRDAPAATRGSAPFEAAIDAAGRFSFVPINSSRQAVLLVADDVAAALWPSGTTSSAVAITFATADASVDVYVLPAFEGAGEPIGFELTLGTGRTTSGTPALDITRMSTGR